MLQVQVSNMQITFRLFSKESPGAWFVNFAANLSLGKIIGEDEKKNRFIGNLTEEAIELLTTSGKILSTYEEMKKFLIQKYEKIFTNEEILGITQGKRSVSEYINEMDTKASKAKVDVDMKIAIIKKELNHEIRKQMAGLTMISSIEEIKQAAMNIEKMINEERRYENKKIKENRRNK